MNILACLLACLLVSKSASCEVGGDTRQGDVDRLTDAGSKQQGPLRTTLPTFITTQHNKSIVKLIEIVHRKYATNYV
jgi:hypothetical protein